MSGHIKELRRFINSPRVKLALTYLAIIMLMSIAFSVVFYHTSARELGRQIPPDSFNISTHTTAGVGVAGQVTMRGDQHQLDSVGEYLQQRATEGRSDLLDRLILLNWVALIAGSVLSYLLARRSLRPIEEAMAAQVQFVSDASHELRTPLTAIQASNEVALRNPKLTLKGAKDVIQRNTEDVVKLKNLSDGLLNLARQTKTVTTTVELPDIISEAMAQVVVPATTKHIAVNDQVPKLSVQAEKHTLGEVVVILLDNAIKYSPDKTTVTLDAQKRGKYVYLHVRDQGIGIRTSDLPHIFSRFYRADSARTSDGKHDGYGLGLAIAKQIMQLMDGDIQVQSTAGQGSVFTVKIPAAEL